MSDGPPPSPAPTAEQFDWGCTNSANGATNGYGWGCAFYSYYSSFYCTYEYWWSGEVYYDDDDFTAVDMCCACSAPTMSPTVPTCYSTDAGALDPYGDDCDDYVANPGWCGDGTYDDDDFSHDEMCCACGGGVTPPTSAPTSTPSPSIMPIPSPTTTFLPTPISPSPTMNCDAATAFSIDSGDCTACGACFHTPNYLAGGDYHHDHDCTITALHDGYLDVLDFNIESSYWWQCAYDGIIVDGAPYCGTDGPQGVYVTTSSTISFYSDETIAHEGGYILSLIHISEPTRPY